MSDRDWKGTAELVGIAAVVASLIFVGLQLRQSEVIARATLYQMRSDAGIELISITLEDREFLASLFQGEFSQDSSEYLQGSWFALALFGHFENSHHLYQLGLLSLEQWQSDRRQLGGIVRNPYLLEFWEADKYTYRESFAVEMDSIIADYVRD